MIPPIGPAGKPLHVVPWRQNALSQGQPNSQDDGKRDQGAKSNFEMKTTVHYLVQPLEVKQAASACTEAQPQGARKGGPQLGNNDPNPAAPSGWGR
jgi:hypothetical protein